MKKIFRVVSQGDPFTVKSEKSEGGQTTKCTIVLQEINGRYADSFVAIMLGNDATCKFYPGDVVYASLRFTAREYNGQMYQDILVTDFLKLNK